MSPELLRQLRDAAQDLRNAAQDKVDGYAHERLSAERFARDAQYWQVRCKQREAELRTQKHIVENYRARMQFWEAQCRVYEDMFQRAVYDGEINR